MTSDSSKTMKERQYYMFIVCVVISGTVCQDCYDVPTSEGLITLEDGMFACAALQQGQGLHDRGKSYVRCVQGNAVVMPCPPRLRWDTSVSACNFPENARCELTQPKVLTLPSGDIPFSTAPATGDVTAPLFVTKPNENMPTNIDSSDYDTSMGDEEVAQSNTCYGAMTSEGLRNLKHDQRACAPLMSGESESDLGQRFVTCSFGAVHLQYCQPGLRFDTSTDSCNWPQLATCRLTAEVPIGTTNAAKPTTTLPPGVQTSRATTTTQRPVPPTRPVLTGSCNSGNCKLPDCFCFGDVPSNISSADTPMFIMLTFDDAVTTSLYNSYFQPLLVDNDYQLYNPSGCRTKSALYVSHENTDYSTVKAIYEAGNEIGSHTIHHRLPQGDKDSDYPGMVAEIQGLKDEVLKATGNKTLVDSILGFRAPYLRVAGDVQFDVLRDYGFLYDTSILNINILQGKVPHWPFTLDFVMGECINPPCPTKPYPGLWEVPLNGWIGDNNQGCSMIDDCNVGLSPWSATEQQWYNFYNRNFQQYFYPVKVPMPIFTHGSLFTNYRNSYPALARWFQDVLKTRQDVWLVTPAQVINWMKNPLTNSEMIAQKWGC